MNFIAKLIDGKIRMMSVCKVFVPLGIRSSLESSGQTDQILPTDSPIAVIEGAKDNLPDESSVEAAKRISELVASLSEGDLLIVLVSATLAI